MYNAKIKRPRTEPSATLDNSNRTSDKIPYTDSLGILFQIGLKPIKYFTQDKKKSTLWSVVSAAADRSR